MELGYGRPRLATITAATGPGAPGDWAAVVVVLRATPALGTRAAPFACSCVPNAGFTPPEAGLII